MKKVFYIVYAALFFLCFSCQKGEPTQVNLDVAVDKLVVDAGDSVTFRLKGSADLITFYSGEPGREYVNRTRTEAEGLDIQLTIASRVLYGAQEKNLRLMLSTKFDGIYTAEHINDDEWIDITDRFTWSTAAPSGIASGTTTSGPVNLSEFIEPGKPIYFGYRYESWEATSAGTAGRVWRLPTFNLEAISQDGEVAQIANVLTAGWKAVPIVSAVNKPLSTSYWTIRSTDPYLWFTPNSTLEPHLHWMITAPFMPTAVNPDKPITLKSLIDPMMAEYRHAFANPGNYVVTIVGRNVNSLGQEEKIQSFNIEVR